MSKLWWVISEEPGKIRLIWVPFIVLAVIFAPHFIGCAKSEKKPFKPAAVHFSYKGHDYISFGETERLLRGYVHDPDCVCGIEIPTVELEE